MGASQSAAETYINSCSNVGIKVVTDNLSKATTSFTQTQTMTCDNCDFCNFDHFDWKQTSTADLTAMQANVSKTNIDARLRSAIKAEAESGAEAAIGIADAKSKIVEDIVNNLTAAIENQASVITEAATTQEQNGVIGHCKEANVSYMNWEQVSKSIQKSFQKNTTINQVKADLVAEVEATNKATAKGWNITWIVMAVVALVLVFVVGGFAGIAKTLLSLSFWVIIFMVAAGFGIYLIASPWVAWPGQKAKADDTEEKKAAIKKHNKTVMEWGAGVTGVGVLGAGVTGFLFLKGRQPKIAAK